MYNHGQSALPRLVSVLNPDLIVDILETISGFELDIVPPRLERREHYPISVGAGGTICAGRIPVQRIAGNL
jgi:hypothetical protein